MKQEMTFVRDKSSGDFKAMYDCALCRQPFQFGQHVYRGQPVRAWNIMLCSGCIKANRDGIIAEHHPELVKHLESQGIEIKHYPNGHIAWPDNHGLRF